MSAARSIVVPDAKAETRPVSVHTVTVTFLGQFVAPANEVWPGAQSVQAELAAEATYRPDVQFMQPEPPVEY